MKKSTHSKIKNAGILFELLSRQITADVLSGKHNSPAIQIIQEAFKIGTALNDEFKLYQILLENKTKSEIKAHYLIEAVCDKYKRLDKRQLAREKYNLIKAIKEHYNVDNFFKVKIDKYKLYASIFRTLQSAQEVVNPADTISSRFTIVEHLTTAKSPAKKSEIETEFVNLDIDTRILAYKSLVEKFNTKYSVLTDSQKSLLREYVNAVSDTTTLKTLVKKQAISLQEQLTKHIKSSDSTVAKVKLTEVNKLLTKYKSLRTIEESHVLQLMLFHELIKELKND